MSQDREVMAGLVAALGAFGIWGLAPMYFKLLGHVAADEIIAHRVLWSVVFLGVALWLRNRGNLIAQLRVSRRVLATLLVTGALILLNWLIFVYAVNTDRILSTSLGYFINPLMSVLLGLLVFQERLNAVQTAAVVLAAVGTIYMTVRVGEFPWIALVLALTFALYSVFRKKLDVGPMVGLFWETLLMAPIACLWLWWMARGSGLTFDPAGEPGSILLFAGTDLITLVPLLLFAAAVRRLALSTIGILQYLAPSMTFCLAVFVYGEPFTLDHAITFACIWVGLVMFSWAGWSRFRRARIPV